MRIGHRRWPSRILAALMPTSLPSVIARVEVEVQPSATVDRGHAIALSTTESASPNEDASTSRIGAETTDVVSDRLPTEGAGVRIKGEWRHRPAVRARLISYWTMMRPRRAEGH